AYRQHRGRQDAGKQERGVAVRVEHRLDEGRGGTAETAPEEREPHERLNERDHEHPGIPKGPEELAGVESRKLASLAHAPSLRPQGAAGDPGVGRLRTHCLALRMVA